MASISETASGIPKDRGQAGPTVPTGQCEALTGSRTNEIARYAVATGVRKREDACTTRLRRLDFLGEVVVTRRAEAMRPTAGGGIEPRCVSIVFLAEPARLPCLSIVMHQPTEMTDQKYVGVRSEVRSGHITNL